MRKQLVHIHALIFLIVAISCNEKNQCMNVYGLGERAYIRFDHGSEPLAKQWLRLGRQLVLSQLSL